MFFVIDKTKIVSYIVAICTVVILFVAAAGLNNSTNVNESIMTSTNAVSENSLTSNMIGTNAVTNNVK